MPPSSLKWRTATRLVHEGSLRSQYQETCEAIFMTQGFNYPHAEAAEARFNGQDPGFAYARYSSPTVDMFENRMCALEGKGAEAARATGSGMAAVFAALMGQLKAGDHVLAPRAMFSSCRYIVEELLPRYGISYTLVDGTDIHQWQAGMRPTTRTLFLESPTNPQLDVIDMAAVARIAHAGGATLIVDNVFATPLLQSPFDLGADCVVYSATKHIDGQGRCLGGVILGSKDFIEAHVHQFLRHTGPTLSPFNAWLLLKGLETLPVRVRQQVQNAEKMADHLASYGQVARVIYPSRSDHPHYDVAQKQMRAGGTLVAFEIKGGKSAAFRFLNALSLIKISNNLGDAKSLITHPATTTHSNVDPSERAHLGISEGLLRLSLGLEDFDDLRDDVDHAMSAV